MNTIVYGPERENGSRVSGTGEIPGRMCVRVPAYKDPGSMGRDMIAGTGLT